VSLSPQENEHLQKTFAEQGYAILPNVVSKPALAQLSKELRAEFERAKRSGELFSGGGMISGHLNCFPGEQSRFVYESLRDYGIIDLVRTITPAAVRMPNVGCNMNLPGSSPQNYHIDGYAAQAFMVVNIAAVDTTIENGAMEASPYTHHRDYKYWQFVVERPSAIRVEMKQGDVLIRTSALWHRGMPNLSDTARPMLALTWEDGGSPLDDPYQAYEGKIRFFPNRYRTDLAGNLRERAFVAVPALGSSYRFVRSFFEH